jgi:hypothetical protein
LNYDRKSREGVGTHFPLTNVNLEGFAHVKHPPGPGLEQLAQLGSQFLQVNGEPEKTWVELVHVARQRPSWKTGRLPLMEHDRHSLKEVPLQVLQSG